MLFASELIAELLPQRDQLIEQPIERAPKIVFQVLSREVWPADEPRSLADFFDGCEGAPQAPVIVVLRVSLELHCRLAGHESLNAPAPVRRTPSPWRSG